ncbi:MAG: hypothetical protein EBT85_08335 [Synechococcaceae bacterium WB5_2B_268]|nr:hypothetical protein [Synechococcaceae bacterium WB5_2B_268]
MRRITHLESFCIEGLEEQGLSTKGFKLFLDLGEFYTFELGVRPMLFPKRIWKNVSQIPKDKTKDFTFRGQIYSSRDWIRQYPNVIHTEHGTNLESRISGFDHDYYADMCASKFTLCPIGVESYSYRTLEAICCHSIPIIGTQEIDLFLGNWFAYYRHGGLGPYRQDWIEHNYRVFLQRHTYNND